MTQSKKKDKNLNEFGNSISSYIYGESFLGKMIDL